MRPACGGQQPAADLDRLAAEHGDLAAGHAHPGAHLDRHRRARRRGAAGGSHFPGDERRQRPGRGVDGAHDSGLAQRAGQAKAAARADRGGAQPAPRGLAAVRELEHDGVAGVRGRGAAAHDQVVAVGDVDRPRTDPRRILRRRGQRLAGCERRRRRQGSRSTKAPAPTRARRHRGMASSGLKSRTSCSFRPGAYGVSCRAREPLTARSARCPGRYDCGRLVGGRANRFAPARRQCARPWVPRSPSFRTRTTRQVNQ